MNKVSIIIPVYKVEQYLRNCINSIINQSYNDWEMILIDDGSPDNCPTICDEYAKSDSRIKVIHKTNGGLSSARNAGLSITTGNYIMFVDSDDFLHIDTLADCMKIATEENAEIVQFGFIRGTATSFPEIAQNEKIQIFDNHSIFESRIQKIIMCGKLYKKELWYGIKMPHDKINEDDYTTWKLYYRSNKTVYLDTPYYYYTINPTSIMAGQKKVLRLDFIEAYLERISFFEKESELLLTDLSKWRFCLPLMLNYIRGNVKKSDLPVLLKYFRRNVGAAIKCSKVPFIHRFLFSIFSIWPQTFRFAFVLIGKAKTF